MIYPLLRLWQHSVQSHNTECCVCHLSVQTGSLLEELSTLVLWKKRWRIFIQGFSFQNIWLNTCLLESVHLTSLRLNIFSQPSRFKTYFVRNPVNKHQFLSISLISHPLLPTDKLSPSLLFFLSPPWIWEKTEEVIKKLSVTKNGGRLSLAGVNYRCTFFRPDTSFVDALNGWNSGAQDGVS